MRRQRKELDLIKHFKRIVLREIKPIANLLAEQVTYLGTFSRVIADVLGYSVVSIINKINLLKRLDDSRRVDNEIVNEVMETINEIEYHMATSKVPLGLKAYGLSTVAVSRILLGQYDKGIELFDDVVGYVNGIESVLIRSNVLSDVLFNLGMIRRFTRRGTQEIPEEVIDSLSSKISGPVQRLITETNFITDAFVRAKIFVNIGFGTRLFSIVSRNEIMAQWYDVNQSQSLALDALSEANKIGDWYKRGIILSNAAAVLAISGDDTVNIAMEKFDEATELAFRYLNKYPLKAASLLGRIAYDKAFTKFYMDSDKFFFESIIIPLEVAALGEALPIILKILRLASKARYFYVIYEVVKDWLLPLIDREGDIIYKAKLLAMCSTVTIPVSVNWARSIAREALSLSKSVIDTEMLPIYYDVSLIDDPLAYVSNILNTLLIISNAAFPLPKDSVSFSRRVLAMVEKLLNLYVRRFKKSSKYRIVDKIIDFNRRFGIIIASLRRTPRLYEEALTLADKFLFNIKQLFIITYGSSSLERFLADLAFIHGLSSRGVVDVTKYLNSVMNALFSYERNMWGFKNEEILRLIKNRDKLRMLSDILRIIVEVSFLTDQKLKDTVTKILIDLSESMDQKTYTTMFMSIIEKIERKEISRYLLTNVLNVLIDEGKMSKSTISRRFYKVINSIDPLLARFISEEIS